MLRSSVACRCVVLALLSGVISGCAIRPKEAVGPDATAIEAATQIDFPSERLAVLERIASRESLSQPNQTYLVDAILCRGFSSDQADALIALLENPRCTDETREYVTKRIQWIGLGSEERRVVEALIKPRQSKAQSADEGGPSVDVGP
jgi:type IV pilus biogenesis protein CpaD/CtpE